MFFKRKLRNRRLHRGGVLDVKLRSDQARATRNRTLVVGLGVVFGTIFCLGLLWFTGAWALKQLVYENPAFAITAIEVHTDGVIAPDQIQRWARVQTGQNLMSLDLPTVKRDLELEPLIQSVSVERVLPHTLRIRVTEREPIAQVNVPRVRPGGGLDVVVMQLDAEGYVMSPLDPRLRSTPLGQADGPLPVITGVNPLELLPGRQIETPQVRSALGLVAKFSESPMAALADLSRVDVTAPQVLIATTGQGSEITFGLENFDQQLLRWREIYEQGLHYNKTISTLDLAVPNNIPARWMEAASTPPKTARPVKRPHTRNRNV